ncbi:MULTISPECIES: TetR/AcrR family transcriptional regulator [Microbacterium]|jgi:AcrR family transcriptional regulator|uniref:TetR/AcrR family transcriptional regulator n=1 Tax=Microbacterium TaxID=33882 RepID=UPI001D172928|nr:TetR/AcrR family transcriptional regulator [Microbacterium schleiferi]MCC4266947.1 TetR/AcrR family transcriptional regulator [Microbacterium schleiferi]
MVGKPGVVRGSLDRGRIIGGAVELADDVGLEPLTIRRLADHLGVKPMSLYHYVSSKDDIVDGMVGRVFDEVGMPDPRASWDAAVRERARSLRAALRRHPWAIPIMESRRTPGVDILKHHDAMLATWMRSGMPLWAVAHGVAVIDAFVYGFAMQEAALPLGGTGGDLSEAGEQIVAPLSPDEYPALLTFTVEHVMKPGYDFGDSFEVGLDVILSGVTRLASAQ